MPEHIKHEFIGEAQGNALAEWLNRTEHKAERGKVVELIAAIKELNVAQERDVRAGMARAGEEARKAGQKAFVLGKALSVSRQYLKMLHRVDHLLGGCWMRPRLIEHGGKCGFDWLYQKAGTRGVHLLIQLMELGVLDSIRTCDRKGCGKWLFVTYPTKRFCSGDCQRRDYQNSEEWKRRRRLRYQAGRRRRA